MTAYRKMIEAFLWFSAMLLFPYAAMATEPDAYENDNKFSRAAFILPGSAAGPQRHNFHSVNDEDWVKFHGNAGKFYTININNPGIDCNPAFELYDSNGNRIYAAKDDNPTGEEEYLDWLCLDDGFYFIKVYQADSHFLGNKTNYEISLIIPSGCADSGIQGIVTDTSDGKPIAGAAIQARLISSGYVSKTQRCKRANNQNGELVFSDESGYYRLFLDAGDYELAVQASGYKSSSLQATVYYESDTDGSIALHSDGHNCNALSDAVSILKIMSDINTNPPICLKNQKVDMAQVIYILQTISGLR